MRGRARMAVLSLAIAAGSPLSAWAKPCGDAVDGRDVPCACGDTVVSDVALGDDPVIGTVCSGDGLIVRAGKARQAVTVDLRGATLRGNGRGNGIWFQDGGAGGARLISSTGRATLEGFRDGVMAHGPDSVVLIDGVNTVRSGRDGIRVSAVDFFEVRNTEARDSGRDGYSFGGKGFRITGTRAVNSERYGYFIMGGEAVLGTPGAGNVSEGSGNHGFILMGMGHRLVDCAASKAGKDGVHINGMHFEVRGCVVSDNKSDGIGGVGGGGWVLAGNQANDNDGNGILVGGPGVEDGGGNSGSGNRGLKQPRAAVQCRIAGAPCRP